MMMDDDYFVYPVDIYFNKLVDLILFTPDHILFHNSMQNGHNGNALWSHGLQNL